MDATSEISSEVWEAATSTLGISGRFDYLSSSILLKGTEYIAYEPFDDAPKKGKFDWLGLVRNIAIGVAVAAVLFVGAAALAAATVATGGAAAVAAGIAVSALQGAAWGAVFATVFITAEDVSSGNVRSWQDATQHILVEALCGAITGACSAGLKWLLGPLSKVHPRIAKLLSTLGSSSVDVLTGFISRFSEASMNDEMTAEERHDYIFNGWAIGFDAFGGVVIDFSIDGLSRLLSGGRPRVNSLADLMSPEDAERYLKFLENGSSAGLTDAEKYGIGKVDEFLALQRVNYQDILDQRRSWAERFEDAFEDVRRLDQINVDFNYNSKYNRTEFERQLLAQQEGMNRLTVQEYLDNRAKFNSEGRSLQGNIAQQTAREQAYDKEVKRLMQSGLEREAAEKQASKWLETLAALHNPDQIAGGFSDIVEDLGDKSINSSIGSQWRYRIDAVDEQIAEMIKNMTEAERKSTFLNVLLNLK